MIRSTAAAAVLVMIGVLVAGCGGNESHVSSLPSASASASLNVNAWKQQLQGSPTQTTKPYVFDGRGADVSAQAFGRLWPFTVAEGRVNCVTLIHHRIAAVFTTDDRKYYWLNKVAQVNADALETRSPKTILRPSSAKGLAVLAGVCAPLDR